MAGFDEGALYFSQTSNVYEDSENSPFTVKTKSDFKEFIRTFRYTSFNYLYLEILRRNCEVNNYSIEIDLTDLQKFKDSLYNEFIEKPREYIDLLAEVISEITKELNLNTPAIQILLKWSAQSQSLRQIHSSSVSKLVKIAGIVISSSDVRSKAVALTLQCRGCRQYLPNIAVKSGMNGYSLPRKCVASNLNARVGVHSAAVNQCPVDPYFIVADKCRCIDYQTIKVQEAPDNVPHGEVPRHVQLYCDRYLCEKAVPGNRITVVGIYSIAEQQKVSNAKAVTVENPYLHVLGIDIENVGSTRSAISNLGITDAEESGFRAFANMPGAYEIIARSIAPGIFGSDDVKKAIACLLFGGSRKRLPDGLLRRGDINLLLLGDPGTAKSQLLKFVEQCAPVAVYTSGKGSSAAGLTASVHRDPASRKFVMEGGAMVLADGGVVCIDEFDKMREDDRVAIHEAMEQQTISIAKAGITTMLNSRCSVLAAANSVYGHWDDNKASADNIDLMPTILSRFDMIFVMRDVHDEVRDQQIMSHLLRLHTSINKDDGDKNNLSSTAMQTSVDLSTLTKENGVIPQLTLKKYIAFCRERCGPRLTEEAGRHLVNQYVLTRASTAQFERDSGRKTTIPITVRQMEAMVRIAESLAKMRLANFATVSDVEEAIRLFQVSTMEAALKGNLDGVEDFAARNEHDALGKLEKQLKRRFVIGSQVSEQTVVQDFIKQGFEERIIKKVLCIMIRRGEIQPKMQKRLLFRVK